MTDTSMDFLALIQKSDDGDFLKTIAEVCLQRIMEQDVENVIGAGRHERSDDRVTYRNGFRDRTLETRLGTLDLKVPNYAAAHPTSPPFSSRGD